MKKNNQESHVVQTKYGMGSYYGTAIKQKIGRMRDGWGQVEATPKELKTPPKSLA